MGIRKGLFAVAFRRVVAIFACLAAPIAGVALAKEKAAPRAAVEAKTSEQSFLSLAEVLQKYRERASLAGFKGALADRAAAQNAVEKQLFPGPWNLAVAGEKAVREGGEAKLDVTAKKKIAFGIDKDAVSRRYQSEAKAELISKHREAREQELEIAKLFTQLRQKQEATEVNGETLSLLEPLEKKANAAAQLGTLGGFLLPG